MELILSNYWICILLVSQSSFFGCSLTKRILEALEFQSFEGGPASGVTCPRCLSIILEPRCRIQPPIRHRVGPVVPGLRQLHKRMCHIDSIHVNPKCLVFLLGLVPLELKGWCQHLATGVPRCWLQVDSLQASGYPAAQAKQSTTIAVALITSKPESLALEK